MSDGKAKSEKKSPKPEKILGSRLYLIRRDENEYKNKVLLIAHGGGSTGKTFSNVGGPTVRFYAPEGEILCHEGVETLSDFFLG
jgi:hypothetical protein